MRMITLGESLQDLGAEVTLFAHDLPDLMRELATGRGLLVKPRTSQQKSREVAREIPRLVNQAIVFDGYDFDSEVFAELFERGERMVLLDDNGDHAAAHCSVILNPNLHASEGMYVSNQTQPVLLLGTNYALIRKEIRETASVPLADRSGVVLSLGGTDVLGKRRIIERHLQESRSWQVKSAKGLIGTLTTSSDEMATALACSKAGLIAVGTTTWEALCVGLPIVGVVVADNQVLIADSLHNAGLATSFDIRNCTDFGPMIATLAELYDSSELLSMRAQLGKSYVDGQGAARTAAVILGL